MCLWYSPPPPRLSCRYQRADRGERNRSLGSSNSQHQQFISQPQPLYSSHSYPQQTPQTHSIHQLTHLHHDPTASLNQYMSPVKSDSSQTLSLQHFSQKPLLPQQPLPQPISPQKVQLQHQEPLHISFPPLIKQLEKSVTQSKTDHSAATSLAPPPPHPLHPVASALPFSVHPPSAPTLSPTTHFPAPTYLRAPPLPFFNNPTLTSFNTSVITSLTFQYL